jgi:Rap1a immunity proteins
LDSEGVVIEYIDGVDEGLQFLLLALNEERAMAPNDKFYYMPDHISRSQMRTIVLTFVKRLPSPSDPGVSAKPAAIIVYAALEQEFPCKN